MTTAARPILLGTLSGGLLVLSLPNPDLYPLAWIALVPLLGALQPPISAWRAAAAGYAAGLVFFGGSCYWLADAMRGYGGLTPVAAWAVTGLFALVEALFFALFAWALRTFILHLGRRGLLAAPPLWVTVELVRTYVPFGGFPWMLSGYALVPYSGLLQIVTWTGVYGLSFVATAVNAAFASAVLGRSFRWAAAAAAAIGASWVLPVYLYIDSTDAMTVRLVQVAIPLDQQWGPVESAQLEDRLGAVSIVEGRSETIPRLIVWPETPAPFALSDPEFRSRAAGIATRSKAYFLLGYIDRIGESPSNSAALIDPEGRIVSRYDKMHLVPFGEYIPMKGLLQHLGSLVENVGGFAPGNDFTISAIGNHRLATAICYESVFPDLVRRFADRGAELLIVITNDSWYGESAAPFQHLRMGLVRAVENRRYLVRVGNTGVTVIVDPWGRITAQAPRNERTAVEGVVHFRSDRTFYTQYGDVFAYLNAALVVLAGLAIVWLKLKVQSVKES